jgi:hypothetical protein
MSRSLLVAFVAVAFLVAPAALPNAIAPGLSGSAHAVTNLNSSRSNVYRTKSGSGANRDKARMGGGGGRGGGSGFVEPGLGLRMGGGGGTATSGGGAGKTK